jgi:hypothetical protein
MVVSGSEEKRFRQSSSVRIHESYIVAGTMD